VQYLALSVGGLAGDSIAANPSRDKRLDHLGRNILQISGHDVPLFVPVGYGLGFASVEAVVGMASQSQRGTDGAEEDS
jgi:methyl coenzyme M reductase subunit D